MKEIRLHPLPLTSHAGCWTRRCRIERWDEGVCERSCELFYQVEDWVTPPDEDDCDSYVRAVLLDAMRESRKLRVFGKVSKLLLGNLVELQGVWRRWKPREYRAVEVEVATVDESCHPPAEGAVCAYSGGVDASFTLWRHSQGLCGHRSRRIDAAVLVHGFDIPLQDESAFEIARRDAESAAADVGVRLCPIRTNFREVVEAYWLDVFGLAVVSATSQLCKHSGSCLLAACEPYGNLVEVLGSTPMTDHLMSGGGFEVIHDGATHSRIEKIEVLTTWPAGLGNLRVCWQLDAHGRNCGKCEKCVRNKICLLLCGASTAERFPDCDMARVLGGMKPISPAHWEEWRLIIGHGSGKQIAPYLKDCLRLVSLRSACLRWAYYGYMRVRYPRGSGDFKP